MKGLRLLNNGQWNKPPVLLAARRILIAGLAKQSPLGALGDAADFLNGTSYDTGKVSELGIYPIIRISNITDPISPYLRTAEELPERFWITQGDLLVSWSASFKSILWTGPDGYLNQHIFKVSERPGFVRSFIRHAIEASFEEMQENVVGIGMMHLRRADFLGHQIPCPPIEVQQAVARYLDWLGGGCQGGEPHLPETLDEQRRIVARLEALAAKIGEARSLRQLEEQEIRSMQRGAFARITKLAPRRPMGEVAPLIRRPVEVEIEGSYPELGIRSFGNGTFHKPALSGFELGSKRVFWIEPGDLLFSNVFAWEGAIAVAKPEDRSRVGSHRFITCVPRKDVATSQFLRFYFLTDEGLELIRAASPGGAGRNRTLGLAALETIEVPVPPIEAQIWFDGLQAKVDVLKRLQTETAAELDAMLPAILDRAFKGELL